MENRIAQLSGEKHDEVRVFVFLVLDSVARLDVNSETLLFLLVIG